MVLENSKLYLRGEIVEAGLAVEGDKIVKVGKETNLPPASKRINIQGRLILPGLIDAHVHLRDQDLKYKEDFFTGTSAAANGGVTVVIDMPNNRPVTMDRNTLRERMRIAAEKTVVNVAFYSAFPEEIEEMKGIVEEGAKGFKLFLSEKIGGLDSSDDEVLIHAFQEAAGLRVPIAVHAEEGVLMKDVLLKMKSEGVKSLDAHLKLHSEEVEVKAIERIIKIAERGGAHVHICHVTTSKGIEIISLARSSGVRISCEVTPHHLLLSSDILKDLGSLGLTNPPLRSSENVWALWSAFNRGLIDIIASDHAPHALEEKRKTIVWEIAPGFVGLETLLPLMLTKVNSGCLSLSTLVRAASKRPAEIFHIDGRGSIDEGCYADLTVVDMKKEWRIDSSKFHSKAKFSPFDGWKVKGKPIKTFINGCLVMDDGEIIAKPGDGRIIR